MSPNIPAGRASFLQLASCALAVLAVGAGAAAQTPEWSYLELTPPARAGAQSAPGGVGLVLDDGTAEGVFGVVGATSRPFLWFQTFAVPPRPFLLAEIWVLFPDEPALTPGVPVQLVVYRDDDDDPATGAELLLAVDETVQAADGHTFSVYPLASPVLFKGGRALIGVVSRFAVAGVTPPTHPAALDTSSPAGRAWVATWTGDPPDPPLLPPDQGLFRIDQLVAGNWMIRGYGSVESVPTLGLPSLAVLILLLAALGWRRARA